MVLVRELAQRVLQHGDALMTIAQQLEQKGIEKGIQLGRQEGKLEVARSLLKMGMLRESAQEATGLSEDDLAQIHH
ncbi:putative transposase [Yersinia wautersii]|uniref:Transposase n=1 Tax=Yersinia wautersii TaxID=1341643 RepID=A0ABM9TCC9_9GAMM|nr:putative transposase [Yersinia wautersii]CRY72585.1 putative transposase [Yersinia pseudotuberculosis]